MLTRNIGNLTQRTEKEIEIAAELELKGKTTIK